MTRYIDADVLRSVFTEKSTENVIGIELCKAIIDRIDRTPTADLATVKPGKWIKITEDFDIDEPLVGRCSVCGWFAGMDEANVVGMNYCPNCGADMRKDDPSHPLADSDDIYGG